MICESSDSSDSSRPSGTSKSSGYAGKNGGEGTNHLHSVEFRCEQASVDDILSLRARELRAGKPVDSARFPEDHDPLTFHFAAWFQNRLIGCLTLIGHAGESMPTWQLRGMATDKSRQNMGVGRALLLFAESCLSDYCRTNYGRPKARIWCNARTLAVPFYRKMGYEVISDEFMIEHVGPHYKMEKNIL